MLQTYTASPTNRRRATKAEMQERAHLLVEYARKHGPITVRGLYYQAEVHIIAPSDRNHPHPKPAIRKQGAISPAGAASALSEGHSLRYSAPERNWMALLSGERRIECSRPTNCLGNIGNL
jgi:hypothetical protein